ncbi:hypothetical protein TSAR_009711 [Trichomalopsis sarcophagae]|uniref:DUF4806 domain-containing protein n=1 Tax=Trichomalopsis sarcophagae TaxID=543379 RepID=A0A232EDK6_9HYME|nr:hypothetical protein TSAR_009711 [Trichomalopsis sarcophagae]
MALNLHLLQKVNATTPKSIPVIDLQDAWTVPTTTSSSSTTNSTNTTIIDISIFQQFQPCATSTQKSINAALTLLPRIQPPNPRSSYSQLADEASTSRDQSRGQSLARQNIVVQQDSVTIQQLNSKIDAATTKFEEKKSLPRYGVSEAAAQIRPSTSRDQSRGQSLARQNIVVQQDSVTIQQLNSKIDFLNRKIAKLEGSNNAMNTRLANLEKTAIDINQGIKSVEQVSRSMYEILANITRSNNKRATTRPASLPFNSTADLVAFDHCSEETFRHLVDYLNYSKGLNPTDTAAKFIKNCFIIDEDLFTNLTWHGSKTFDHCSEETFRHLVDYLNYSKGLNPTDTAAKFIKNCFIFDEDLFTNLTWHGSKTNNHLMALKSTKFAKACEEAMPLNPITLMKPTEEQFSVAMTKALKSAKEGYRRKRKQPTGNEDIIALQPQPQRPCLQQRQQHNNQLERKERNDNAAPIDDNDDNGGDNGGLQDDHYGGQNDYGGYVNQEHDGGYENQEHDDGGYVNQEHDGGYENQEYDDSGYGKQEHDDGGYGKQEHDDGGYENQDHDDIFEGQVHGDVFEDQNVGYYGGGQEHDNFRGQDDRGEHEEDETQDMFAD